MHRVIAVCLVGLLACCNPTMIDRSSFVAIDEGRFVELGGMEQRITIRGDRVDRPILLVVHGGPGDVQSPLTQEFAPYEREFVVVQWDQRGSGRTFGRHRESTPNLTFDQLAQDGIELSEYLSERFETPIVLFGHSQGTIITTFMAQRRPELFFCYLGTGQVTSSTESIEWQFDFLVKSAGESGDEEVLAHLEQIGEPDPTDARQYFGYAQYLGRYFHESDANWLSGLRDRIVARTSEVDLEMIADGTRFSARALLQDRMSVDLRRDAILFELPYFVVQGCNDISTPTPLVEDYFAKIAAPVKEMVIIEDAGHFALVTHAADIVAVLKGLIEQLTVFRGGS